MFLFAPRKFECKILCCLKKMASGVAQVATSQLHFFEPKIDLFKTGFCTDGGSFDGNRRQI
jgi:hypothetical protein